jgi:hypothetical protein
MIESCAVLVLGAIGLWGGLHSYLGMDARMQSSMLKPGIYVCVLSAGLMLTALIYGYLGVRAALPKPVEAMGEHGEAAKQGSWAGGIVVVVFGLVALYAFLISLVGYLPATLFFLLAQFRVLGVKSWPVNVALTIAATAMLYVVFIYYGGLEFPRGGLLD